MIPFFIILTATELSGANLGIYERITLEVAVERVAHCGAGSVTVESNQELDTDVLVVAGSAPISDEQVSCIAKAASFYEVRLPTDAQPRLNAITEARGAALVKAQGHQWLAAHNLVGRLPKYEAGVTDDTVFARKIEKLCKAEGALQSQYGTHALNPKWAARQKDLPLEDQPFACILNVTFASGYKLGFIGNERSTPE